MNIVIDAKFDKEPQNGDILVYQNGKWINLPKKEYLHELLLDIKELKKLVGEVDALKHSVAELRGEE